MKEFDRYSKKDWMKAVTAVIYAIQKARSIKREKDDDPEGLKPDQMKIRNYILGLDKPDKLEGYLKAFIKMEEKGDKLEPMDAYNMSILVNRLYPELGILCLSSDIDIPELTILDIPQMKWS